MGGMGGGGMGGDDLWLPTDALAANATTTTTTSTTTSSASPSSSPGNYNGDNGDNGDNGRLGADPLPSTRATVYASLTLTGVSVSSFFTGGREQVKDTLTASRPPPKDTPPAAALARRLTVHVLLAQPRRCPTTDQLRSPPRRAPNRSSSTSCTSWPSPCCRCAHACVCVCVCVCASLSLSRFR
jgi:hypothetical protein